jgi:peptidoglycan/xylan/chitin deacetylase (PgdA/CDA1 family)
MNRVEGTTGRSNARRWAKSYYWPWSVLRKSCSLAETMNPLTQVALAAQAKVVAPFRAARVRRLAAIGQAPLSVLFYHRVADVHPNNLTISKAQFTRHVEYCRENYEPISLSEVQRRIRDNDSYIPSVTFTFDDGYQDNCDFAIPLLLDHQFACTYFVTTGNVLQQTQFGHDQANGVQLRINTARQIRQMSDAGIEIGCHTRTHPNFANVHDLKVIRDEIINAKQETEQLIGRAVRYFAFPFGTPQQLTQAAIETVYEAGFAGFCSAYGAYNLVGQDAFHIRRIHGDGEFARFVNWLSFDERKRRQEPEIKYFLPPLRSFADSTRLTNTTAHT